MDKELERYDQSYLSGQCSITATIVKLSFCPCYPSPGGRSQKIAVDAHHKKNYIAIPSN